MSYTLESVKGLRADREVAPGVWVAALPLPEPLRWRIRDAWDVLRGRAIAARESTIAEARHHRLMQEIKQAEWSLRAVQSKPRDNR